MIYSILNMTKTFGKRKILDIPSMELDESKIYALLGPNGAGKTTLINILAFLDSPTTGEVWYRSKPVRYFEPELHLLRKHVVMVDQHPILFSTTVYKNLEFGLKIRGIPKVKRDPIIHESMEIVGMQKFENEPAHRLSGGETQRVALARALAVSPEVLFCDEPTSSVDVENQEVIVNTLKQINAEKSITIFFTTHDRNQALSLAHHTLTLNHGRPVSEGYDNIFSGMIEKTEDFHFQLDIQGILKLPAPDTLTKKDKKKVKVLIDPKKIELILSEKKAIDYPLVSGRIKQISEENGNVRIAVNIGILLAVLLPFEIYRKSKPLIGENVRLYIPPGAITIV